MKKIATLLVFVLSIQVATPSFAQTSAAAQTKALQNCMEGLINKALAPENLKNVDLGKRKFLDQLAASKALLVWSLGDNFKNNIKQPPNKDIFALKGAATLISSSVSVSYPLLILLNKSDWKKEFPKSQLIRKQIIYSAVAIVFSIISFFLIRNIVKEFSGTELNYYMEGIIESTSNDEFYQRIADDESQEASKTRALAIEGCHEIQTQIQHFIESPDLFIADMEQMKGGYSSPVLQDSGLIDGIKTPIIHFPSGEKGFFTNPKDSVRK